MATSNDFNMRSWTRQLNAPFYDGNNPSALRPSQGAGTLQFTPTYLLDAENATVGSTNVGAGSNQWSESGWSTFIDDERSFDGTRSFEINVITAGQDNFGDWGQIKNFPALTEGDSVQCQVSSWFPLDYDFTTGNGHLKFLRFNVVDNLDSNRGYHDILISTASPYYLKVGNELEDTLTQIVDPNATHPKGTWVTVEFRVDFSTQAAGAGGTGRVMVWCNSSGNMELVYNQPQPTLVASTDQCKRFLLHTNFNGAPTYPSKIQKHWADRIVIETNLANLVETDGSGNGIIGGLV